MIDDNRTTGGQSDFALKGRFNLPFNLVAVKKRHVFGVHFQFAQILRHVLRHESLGLSEYFRFVNQDLANIAAEVVAQSTHDDVTFLVDQR